MSFKLGKWEFPEFESFTGFGYVKFTLDPLIATTHETEVANRELKRASEYIDLCLKDVLHKTLLDGREYYFKAEELVSYRQKEPPYTYWLERKYVIGLINLSEVEIGDYYFMKDEPKCIECEIDGKLLRREGNHLWKRIK